MNRTYNYLRVNKPYLPVYSSLADCSKPFGEFFVPEREPSCSLEEDIADVSIQDLLLPNFSMRRSKGKFMQDAVLYSVDDPDADVLGSCLFLKGYILSHLRKRQDQPIIRSWQGQQNFKYDPQNEFSHRIKANTEFDIVHFSVNPEYFLQLLPGNEAWSDRLQARISNKESFLGDHPVAIQRAQEDALRIVLNCPMDGKLGEMMMETAIVQIILLQLHSLFQRCDERVQPSVPKRDVELVHDLRDYLLKTYLEDHSLNDLARNFATNTHKLVTTFKKVFGESIFEYIQVLRMDHARELLLDGDIHIKEVARVLRYKNPNHFSSAFKKRFGVSPSSLRVSR